MEGVSSHKINLELVTNNCKAIYKNYEISLTKKILDVLIDKATTIFFQYISGPVKQVNSCHGLRTPNESFFHRKSQTIGLGQTIWADKFFGH